MLQLVLNPDSSDEENIYKIIDCVKKLEKEKGLSDEEISKKYTQGDCICLASLIKTLLPNVKIKWFGSSLTDAHCCVAIKGDPDKDSKLEDFIDEDLYYYDINGKKYYDEMREFLSSTFHTDFDEISARYPGNVVNLTLNETTSEILKSTVFKRTNINVNKKDDKRKIYSIEKFIELINSPIEKIKLPLILAGNNKMYLDSKTDEELRQMVLDYITVKEEDFLKALESSDSKIVLEFQKAMLLIGLPTDQLFSKLGFNTVLSESKEKSETLDEKEKYLYHTEELFENAIEEFKNSDLSKFERTKKYVEKIDKIRKKYSHYVSQTSGFAGSERFKVVYEYMKTIPIYELYKYDSNSGNYINKVKEKEYYEGIYNELVDSLGELGKSNSI